MEQWMYDFKVIFRDCAGCGIDFETTRSNKIYCSTECREKANRDSSRERYMPKIGRRKTIEDKIVVTTLLGKFTIEASNADKFIRLRKQSCVRCKFSEIVQLHEIIPRSEKDDSHNPDNRLPLCPNCHTTLHLNKWSIWELASILKDNPLYESQYWLILILKSEVYRYSYSCYPPTTRVRPGDKIG